MWFPRRHIKEMLYGVVNTLGIPNRSRESLGGQLIVLTYHSFSRKYSANLFASLPVCEFEKQVCHLKRYFQIVSLQEGVKRIFGPQYRSSNGASGRLMVAITIDDGFQDNYTLAYPILKTHGVPATIFLATDFLDTRRAPWPTQIVEALERTSKDTLEFPLSLLIGNRRQKSIAVRAIMRQWSSLAAEERFQHIAQLRKHLEVSDGVEHEPLRWSQVCEMV